MNKRIAKFTNVSDARKSWRSHFDNRAFRADTAAKIEIRASADGSDTTDMLLYDEIGPWGVTAKDFVTALAGVKTKNLHLRVNSPGGDVFDGLAMYNSLKTFNGDVMVTVEGLAASAASFVAMAASKVAMAKGSFLMIHNAWGFAMGNKGDMTDMANTLGKIDGQIAGIYAEKCGKNLDAIGKLMDGEKDGTWFTAADAKKLGLVDCIDDDDEDDDETGEDDPDGEIEQRGKTRPRGAKKLRFAMAVELNAGGERHAEALIDSGDVDADSEWSFSAADGNKLLEDGEVGARYRNNFLGKNTDEPEDAKAGWEYPFAKGGKLYRHALSAIRTRAAQNDADAVYAAAGRLLDKLDAKTSKDAGAEDDIDDDENETGEVDPSKEIEQRVNLAHRRLRLAEAE